MLMHLWNHFLEQNSALIDETKERGKKQRILVTVYCEFTVGDCWSIEFYTVSVCVHVSTFGKH